MFEALELGRKVTKQDYNDEEPGLHTALLNTQRRIIEAGIPVIIIIAGVEGAGKGETVNLLNKWLDTRGLTTHAFWDDPEAARERPRFWRFWDALPARGTIGIMFGSWYTRTIIDRVFGASKDAEFERLLGRIADFERLLIDDGALIVKFWLHLSKNDQQKRLALDVKEKRMTSPHLKEFADHYDDFISICERAIRATDSGYAPWNMIEAKNRRFRDLSIGRALLSAMERRLAWEEHTEAHGHAPSASGGTHVPVDSVTVLDQLDLTAKLEPEAYAKKLEKYQRKLNQLAWQARAQNRNT
ncbi:MAG: polyphosphate:AMP phosphotransferase, partial [Gammaproteobacteria bacterium]|nr:polyphosphate:AMP phosphotransferase [Gammaproteobacteria bacterium]